ncbi:MAG: YqcI/YcgG family protein, partial [Gemmatimonadaceae bacterium]
MNTSAVEEEFRNFVEQPAFPCLAGKGLVRQRGYTLGVYDTLGSESATTKLVDDLRSFTETEQLDGTSLVAFVAVFRGRPPKTEDIFERSLWSQLQGLHDSDEESEWDPAV